MKTRSQTYRWFISLTGLTLFFAMSGQASTQGTQDTANDIRRQDPTTFSERARVARMKDGGNQGMVAMECTMSECPMRMSGLKIAAESPDNAAVLRFTASSAQLDDLKKRVDWLVEQHNRLHDPSAHTVEVAGDDLEQGNAHALTMKQKQPQKQSKDVKKGMERIPASHARVQTDGNSVLMVLEPSNPSELARLRRHIEHHAKLMNEGGCPMMATGHGGIQKAPKGRRWPTWENADTLWQLIPAGL